MRPWNWPKRLLVNVCVFKNNFPKEINLNKILLFAGCERSQESLKIFEKAEQKNTTLAQYLKRFTIAGQIGTFVPSAFVPIGFALIGFPEPEQWLLPFPAKYDPI